MTLKRKKISFYFNLGKFFPFLFDNCSLSGCFQTDMFSMSMSFVRWLYNNFIYIDINIFILKQNFQFHSWQRFLLRQLQSSYLLLFYEEPPYTGEHIFFKHSPTLHKVQRDPSPLKTNSLKISPTRETGVQMPSPPWLMANHLNLHHH